MELNKQEVELVLATLNSCQFPGQIVERVAALKTRLTEALTEATISRSVSEIDE